MSPARVRDVSVVAGLLVLCATPLADSGPIAAPVSQLPWEPAIRFAFAARQLPLWNPYFFGGQPLLANPAAAVFYPPAVIARLAPIDWTVPLLVFMHTALFASGVYLVVRRVGQASVTAALAAIGALIAVTLAVPVPTTWSVLPAVAWLPLLVAATCHSAGRNRLLPSVTLVLVLSAVFLSGSLRGALYALATVGASITFIALWPGQRGAGRVLGAQGALAVTGAAALTAFQTVPQIEFVSRVSARELNRPRAATAPRVVEHNPSWRALLPALRGHGVASTCDRIGSADLVRADIAVLDGWGAFRPEYARFTSLASGRYPVPDDPPATVASAVGVRHDLLSWMGVEYLVTCGSPVPSGWTLVQQSADVRVYRSTTPPLTAFWTCAPRAVSRDEVEYALATRRFQGVQAVGPRFIVHVRWSERASDPERATAERELGLVPLQFLEQRTWQYELTDAGAVRALVLHPLVEDTAHVDRQRFEPKAIPVPAPSRQGTSEWLLGDTPCPAARAMSGVRQRPYRGRTAIDITAPQEDGVLVLPRTYVPGLKAWVDGERAPLLRVNLTLVAVPVSAGAHRVEVAYLPDGQVYGAALTGFAVLAWAGSWWVSRRRR